MSTQRYDILRTTGHTSIDAALDDLRDMVNAELIHDDYWEPVGSPQIMIMPNMQCVAWQAMTKEYSLD